jgi:hypothetical protein
MLFYVLFVCLFFFYCFFFNMSAQDVRGRFKLMTFTLLGVILTN